MADQIYRVLKSFPSSYLDGPKTKELRAFDLNMEISSSWGLLFTTSNQCTKRNITNYDQLSKPFWVSDENAKMQKSRHLKGWHSWDTPPDVGHLGHRITKPYSQFPIFENRLRKLVFYMDAQKPQGLRQLWRDKRDTLNFYTFWGVIIFGGLSVFLALFSLAVSIAQTVASFRALDTSS